MKFAIASLATAAIASQVPEMYKSAPAESNGSITIDQVAGQANFVKLDNGTYADPDPIQTSNYQKFYVQGVWNVDGSVMDHVHFRCYLAGADVFDQDFPCSTGDANCPLPSGSVGEMWNGVFGFDVPAFAPPFQYDVHVEAFDTAGNSLWELESKFYI